MTGLSFFGPQGAYDTANQQNVLNMQNTATTNTASVTFGSLGAALSGTASIGYYGGSQLMQGIQQYIPAQPTIGDMLEKAVAGAKGVKKKAKGVLAQLRSEIDGWHGDILDRCPA